jgi:hypothetical protein
MSGAHVVIADQAPERIASVTAAAEDLGVQAMGVAIDVSALDRQKIVHDTAAKLYGLN